MSQTLMVSESLFHRLANLDGEVLRGLQLHSVNREAKTMQWGDDLVKVYAAIPDRIFFDELTFPELALPIHHVGKKGAQWKRETSKYRRAAK